MTRLDNVHPTGTAGEAKADACAEGHLRYLVELSRIGTILTSTFDLERILSLLMELSLEISGTEVGSIMLLQDGSLRTATTWGLEEEVVRSLATSSGEAVLERVVASREPFWLDRSSARSVTGTGGREVFIKSFACFPLQVRQRLIGVLTVVNKVEDLPWGELDIELLRGLAQFAAVAIENSRLHRVSLEKQALEKELALAREVQMSLLPKCRPATGRVTVAANYTPAEVVGGDYYDFVELGDDRLALAIGDVSNKGVSAALYMTATRGVLRAQALQGYGPAEVLGRLNEFLCGDFGRTSYMFVSLFYGVLDLGRMRFTFSNAGHCPPVLLRKEGGESILLRTGNTVLGQLPDLEPEEASVGIRPGDTLIFYTDGIIEARNEAGRIFGKNRLTEMLENCRSLDVSSIAGELLRSVESFERMREDDLTLVVLRVN